MFAPEDDPDAAGLVGYVDATKPTRLAILGGEFPHAIDAGDHAFNVVRLIGLDIADLRDLLLVLDHSVRLPDDAPVPDLDLDAIDGLPGIGMQHLDGVARIKGLHVLELVIPDRQAYLA